MSVFLRGSTYYGYVVLGPGRRRRVALTRDKGTSETLLARLQREAELEHDLPGARAATVSLDDNLADYERSLLARGDTERHVKETMSALRAIADGCGWRQLGDFQAGQLESWLAAGVDLGWSPRTRNYHLGAIKALARWLVERRRLPYSPFDCLRRINEDVDLRRVRRSLTPELFRHLLVSTAASALVWRGLSGRDRFHLYSLGGYTGFRAQELASLTTASFALEESPPTVTVLAAHSRKRRERAVQPLHPELASMLRAYLDGRPATAPVWPGSWWRRAAEMLRRDLADAGIPYADDLGAVFDFHAVRGQFITSLARAGVHPKLAQELARHSDINLTMNHYTRLHAEEKAQALNELPPPPAY